MLQKKHERILSLCRAAMIAALYVALTFLSQAFGLASGAIQFRLSETLCILTFFTPAAIPGLTVGCLLANLFTGCAPLDIAVGPIATLIGALGSYFLAKCFRDRTWVRFIAAIPNILANTLIVPFVIYFCYTVPDEMTPAILPVTAAGVAVGEIVTGYILGTALLFALCPFRHRLFGGAASEN